MYGWGQLPLLPHPPLTIRCLYGCDHVLCFIILMQITGRDAMMYRQWDVWKIRHHRPNSRPINVVLYIPCSPIHASTDLLDSRICKAMQSVRLVTTIRELMKEMKQKMLSVVYQLFDRVKRWKINMNDNYNYDTHDKSGNSIDELSQLLL